MTTAAIARFVYGTTTLDINDGVTYALEADFTPPAALLSAQMSDGTSANRSGGATKIGQRAQNRQWSFGVQCLGESEREVNRAIQNLVTFMNYAGLDKSTPLYLEYKPNSDIAVQPRWGQGGWLRYEVRHAQPPQIGDRYGRGEYRARNVQARLALEVAPYALGLSQRLCSAKGAIWENNLGTPDGLSRGVMVLGTTTNYFTNPVFGNATWNTGWTAGASLLADQNTDPRFLLPDTNNSARLSARSASSNTYTQPITLSASAAKIWAIVKRPNGGSVSASQVQMYYNGSTLATDYEEAGNGLWFATASALGSGASAPGGVIVTGGQTIYVCGVQAEYAYFQNRTPLCWGDLLGCAWSGTAHASTSTRTAGNLKLPVDNDTFLEGEWSIGTILTTGPDVTTALMVYDSRDASNANGLLMYISAGQLLVDFSGLELYSDSTLAASTTYVLHVTFDGATVKLYINGQLQSATIAPTSIGTLGGYVYLGSSYSSAQQSHILLKDFTVFAEALSAAAIGNDYNNLAAALADDRAINPTPWLWTMDGDNIVDNCDDSTHHNWCICGGIAGNQDAVTTLQITTSAANKQVWISKVTSEYFVPIAKLFFDDGGTVDATCSGGEYYQSSIGVTGDYITQPTWSIANRLYRTVFSNKEVYLFIRLYDAGANLTIACQLYDGVQNPITKYLPIDASSEFRVFKSLPFTLPNYADLVNGDDTQVLTGLALFIHGKRSTGVSANVRSDYSVMMLRPLMYIRNIGAAIDRYRIAGAVVSSLISVGSSARVNFNIGGDRVELTPYRLNTLISLIADSTGPTAPITLTMTYDSVVVVPRWSLV